MLTLAAAALLIAVLGSITGVLALDVRRTAHGSWLDALRQWQGLLGAVMGFISAAGVLVLGQALQAANAENNAKSQAHAIGLALALETSNLTLPIIADRKGAESFVKSGQAITPEQCKSYAQTLLHDLIPATPVYTAALGNLTNFSDVNMVLFVGFYSNYQLILHSLEAAGQGTCDQVPAREAAYLNDLLDWAISSNTQIARAYNTVDYSAPAPAAVGGGQR
jgi:hypothetical protein